MYSSIPEIEIVNNVQYGNGKLQNHMTVRKKLRPTDWLPAHEIHI